jgi:hypothetical protein
MQMARSALAVTAFGGFAGGLAVLYRALATGQLTLDVDVGRTVLPLGPQQHDIAAPREVVFDVIAEPYLGRTPRALADEIEVLERGDDMVLAAHRTPVGSGMVTTTVETVRFERPHTVHFRLLRGPVPHVIEQFRLVEDDGGRTRLDYDGELGVDFWRLGAWWGRLVAAKWEDTVRSSLTRIAAEAERRSRARG